MTVRVLVRESEAIDWNKRILHWAEYLFLFLGLIALDCYIWVGLDSSFHQAYESWSFDQQVKGQPVSVARFLKTELGLKTSAGDESQTADQAATTEATGTEDSLPGDTGATPQPRAGAETRSSSSGQDKPKPIGLIGRILVPRLRLSAMVQEGVGDDILRRAVGHIPSSALPGQVGNVALAGHRDTFFRKLRDIRKSDKIVMSTLKGDYDYQVESVKIVAPQDISVLRAVPGEQALTLVTCFPFNFVGSAPKRFIVRAHQIEMNATQQAPIPSGF